MIKNELVTDYLVNICDKHYNIVYYNTMKNLILVNNKDIQVIQKAIENGGGIFLSDKSNYRIFDMIFDDRKIKYIDPLNQSFRSLSHIRLKGIIFEYNGKSYFIDIKSFIVDENDAIYDRTVLQTDRNSIIVPFKYPDNSDEYYRFKIDLEYSDKAKINITLIGNTDIKDDIENIKYFCELVVLG